VDALERAVLMVRAGFDRFEALREMGVAVEKSTLSAADVTLPSSVTGDSGKRYADRSTTVCPEVVVLAVTGTRICC
jgi:hypothetical protein